MDLKVQIDAPVLVGIDIEPDNVQISWFGKNMKEPETIGLQVGVDKFKFPFCIFYDASDNDYLIGQAAIDCMNERKEGVFVPQLWHDAILRKKICINSKMISCVDLLHIFFEKLVRIVGTFSGTSHIDAIAYTSKKMDNETIEILKAASRKFAINGTKIFYKTYGEVYAAYLLNQSEELYGRNSILFYMSKGVLDIYNIIVNKKFKPYTLKLQNEQIKGMESYEDLMFATEDERNLIDNHFFAIAKELFGSAIVSTVFLTGDGFDKDWLNVSLKYLCQGRRVFQGKNLFTKGACYFLINELNNNRKYELSGENQLNYIFQIPMWQDGNNKPYNIHDGKGDWYQVDDTIECLLDGQEKVLIDIIVPGKEAEKRTEEIELKGLVKRPTLGTRIKISVKMLNKNLLDVKITDEGLGELYDASGRTWEKKIDLNEIKNSEQKKVADKGKLILCSDVRPSKPFYIKCIEKNVFTIEELCFFFYNELYFVEEFYDWAELSGWLKREMKMEELANNLQKLMLGYDTKMQMIQLILEYARYRSGEELIEYESKMEQIHKSTGFIRTKKRGDYLASNGKYDQAIELYNQILNSEGSVDESIISDVYHNLGVVYGYMFYFERAAEYFHKSFSIMPSKESLKQYKLALRLGERQEAEDDAVLDLSSVRQLEDLLDDEIQVLMENEFDKCEPFDNIIRKKSEGKVSDYYKEIDETLNVWKEECRSYV